LQLVPGDGSGVGAKLVSHPDVDTVILTGGTETALRMLKSKPDLRLLAETGGKNATIVTAMSDRDQAIKNVIHSAFGHAGQKCSATSLLLLEDEVYEDEAFQEGLVDAAKSMHVGSAWSLETRMGPLITPPGGDLERALNRLEPGETWALRPKTIHGSDCLITPGIKWNVSRGSLTHMTEFFGPLLGVMRFRNLREAIDIVNETGYGLTSGLESLDDREQELWRKGIRAGNLYINRPTTGAIVLRQPFGGMGKSAFGPGIKAGGPNYVAQLFQFSVASDRSQTAADFSADILENESLRRFADGLLRSPSTPGVPTNELMEALVDYDRAASEEFLKQHDHFRLIGQDNIRHYLPIAPVCIRVDPQDSWMEIVLRAAAAQAVGARAIISAAPGVHPKWVQRLHNLTESWAGDIEFLEQSDQSLLESIEWGGLGRLRYAAAERVPQAIRRAVLGRYVHIADAPVLPIGRIELLWYVQEQSISNNYHRYGNLGTRCDEERKPTR
jgi:RHH-type proline utilization regulon transcriptional repressor/proline dehydrogenase/delta 1-pyrroline-5-carboxylate dehydrogenase